MLRLIEIKLPLNHSGPLPNPLPQAGEGAKDSLCEISRNDDLKAAILKRLGIAADELIGYTQIY